MTILITGAAGFIGNNFCIDFANKFKKGEKTKHAYGLTEFGLSKESVQNTLSKYISY